MVSLAALHRQNTLAALAKAKETEKVAPSPAPAAEISAETLLDHAAQETEGQMVSLAALHRRTVLARIASASAAEGIAGERPTDGDVATEYELLLAALGADLVRLKDLHSVEAKIALKGDLISAYDAHVDATLASSEESGAALQDDIMAIMMLWRFDIGDFERGLDIAGHVLRFGLRLPSNIVRTPATLIAEEIAEAALRANKAGKPFALGVVDRTMELVGDWDMPDQVKAKLFKARARLLLDMAAEFDDKPESAPAGGARGARLAALAAFRRALELHKGAGVVKDIERLASLEKDCAPAPVGGEGNGTG